MAGSSVQKLPCQILNRPRERLYWLLSKLVNLEIPELGNSHLWRLQHIAQWWCHMGVTLLLGSRSYWQWVCPFQCHQLGLHARNESTQKWDAEMPFQLDSFRWTHHLLVVSKSIQFCVSNSMDSLSECKWCKCSEMTDHHHHHHLPLSNLCRSISRSCRGCSISQAIGPGFLPGIQLSTLLEQCLASFDTQALCIRESAAKLCEIHFSKVDHSSIKR